MASMDHQIMVKDEVTYATAVTVDRTFEYDSESIEETYGRTEGDPLRVGVQLQPLRPLHPVLLRCCRIGRDGGDDQGLRLLAQAHARRGRYDWPG